MKKILLFACFITFGLTSCGNKENTGNGADDKADKGPYQYTNDENKVGNSDSSINSIDSLYQK
ncbi:MAG: hypothetical protein H7141_07440 [Burkholderiales bacterium]|nr:hypothetical protein [Bacteroidia bacterium]